MTRRDDSSSVTPTPSDVRRDGVAARGGPFGWRAVDIVTLAVLGVAMGVAFWGFNVLYESLKVFMAGFPPVAASLLGVWLLPAVLGMLIVRRPGAALLIELIAANLSMVLGSQWGALVLVSAVLQALGVEVVAAFLRWRRWQVAVAVAGGALAAVFEVVLFEFWAYVDAYSPAWKAAYLFFSVASGAIIAGLGSWALMKALAGTGALSAFPPGEDHLLRATQGEDDDLPVTH